ncbi:MAG: hypothetical protein IJE04_00615 [Bacilli bacterium]|nr:hypothetical protein [Bacilli bacterium]
MKKNKKKKNTSFTKFSDNYYISTGGLFLLGLSFYLISEGMAWLSILISLLVTGVCFGIAKKSEKKGWWIFLGILAIIFDVINLIAAIQLFL